MAHWSPVGSSRLRALLRLGDRRRFTGGKHFFGRKQSVQGGREACIDRHLHDDLDDFVPGHADIECAFNVHLQLRCRVAKRRERRHDGN